MNRTNFTLVVGVIVAIMLGFIASTLTTRILGMMFPAVYNNPILGFLQTTAGLTVMIPTVLMVFFPGKFTIPLGYKAYVMLLGNPIHSFFGIDVEDLPAGDGWIFPYIMTINVRETRGLTVNPGEQSNTTENGIEITSNVSGTYAIEDLKLLERSLDTAAIQPFVESTLVAAVRDSIAVEPVSVENSLNKGELTTEEAFLIIKEIARFKHAVEKNGKNIMNAVNEEYRRVGLKLTTIQIEDIGLPAEIEDAAKRVISETVESGALTKDAKNKAAVAEELIRVFGKNGVDWDKLPEDQKADYIDRCLDRAMAAEDKATIHRHNFGGTPPKGMMMNMGE